MIKLRAHPTSDDDVLRVGVQAVLAAIFEDALGKSEADARQSLQFFN